MVIKSVNLETVCGITSTLPENGKPEFAFAGKSNVGKSSLINALIVAVGLKKRGEIAQTYERLERIWDQYDVYEKHGEGVGGN